MIMWIVIISLLVIGLALIIVELVFIPGTTLVGLLGLIFSVVGIVISYNHFGSDIGFYFLMGSLITTLIGLFYSFRTGAWSKFSLKTSIDSRVNEGATQVLKVGDEGTTLSTLRPVGKAEFQGQSFEVKTFGGYVEEGQKVKIVQIQYNQVVVEPLN